MMIYARTCYALFVIAQGVMSDVIFHGGCAVLPSTVDSTIGNILRETLAFAIRRLPGADETPLPQTATRWNQLRI